MSSSDNETAAASSPEDSGSPRCRRRGVGSVVHLSMYLTGHGFHTVFDSSGESGAFRTLVLKSELIVKRKRYAGESMHDRLGETRSWLRP